MFDNMFDDISATSRQLTSSVDKFDNTLEVSLMRSVLISSDDIYDNVFDDMSISSTSRQLTICSKYRQCVVC